MSANGFVKAKTPSASANAAASRHLQALEDRLGARLVERNTRRLFLTDTGREFFGRARVLLADLKDAEDAVNAAVYFPRLRMADPLNGNRLTDFAPCGAVAGIIARTDAQRGVWKAPSGQQASFSGVSGFT